MTKTYTPLIIEGKIYVVVDAPDRVDNYMGGVRIKSDSNYDKELAACTKYETLPEHAPYWEERIGQPVEEKDFYIVTDYSTGRKEVIPAQNVDFNWPESTAIPPQQKQGDEKPDAVKFAEYMDKYYPISDLFNKGESFDGFYQRFKAGLPPQSYNLTKK